MRTEPSPASPGNYALHDDALERLAPFGPGLANGLFDHAPMVVEALAALGEGAHARAWIDRYGTGFSPRPESAESLSDADRARAIGDGDAYEALAATFARDLRTQDWRAVLDDWCGRLAPGFVSSAVHGVLRTAHAARALAVEDTPARRAELADALAAWAASYLELPVELLPSTAERSVDEALAALTPVPVEVRPGRGLLMAAYPSVAHCPNFAQEVAAADLGPSVLAGADAVAVAFARRFTGSVSNDFEAIALTHTITGAVAVARLAPHVSEDAGHALLSRAWEAGCALVASFGQSAAPLPPERSERQILGARARAHGDDHVIKLTEACLEVEARTGEPILIEVADRARALLPPLHGDR